MTTTNRTKELFDFAQLEPVLVSEFEDQLAECTDEEVAHVEQVAGSLLLAARNIDAERTFAREREAKNEQVN